ncbi:MAG: ABC transporter permease [Lachnospiraceae bacterium]|nr:ABC transporter permease [Lachnospiraceae bacterium]
MRFADKFSMAWNSLTKRKLRTLLTILGVMIGIASIVIMMGLGEGLKLQTMQMIEEYGGLRTVEVREGTAQAGAAANASGATTQSATDYKLNDNTIEEIEQIEHVESVYPVLEFQAEIEAGKYKYSLFGGKAMPLDVLKDMTWEFADGEWPEENDELKFIYGNLVIQDFQDSRGNNIYWNTGKLADIDLMEDRISVIFDTEAYNALKQASKAAGTATTGTADGSAGGTTANVTTTVTTAPATTTTTVSPPKKYPIETAGVLAGGLDDYKEYAWNTYCDIEALKKMYKKVFKNKAIPGQPVRKNGKPYTELFYSSLMVIADEVSNVEEVQKTIADMGYQANSNSEWIRQTEQQSRSQQAMLGGIGAVSLLVAAIGIANTMMMSIYERTKEIGVMKVLGCGLRDIQQLFLVEAGLIGLFGGMAGILISVLVCFIINKITGMTTALIPVWMYPLSVIFAILVSMLAGYAPSKRAMKLSALDAIRSN